MSTITLTDPEAAKNALLEVSTEFDEIKKQVLAGDSSFHSQVGESGTAVAGCIARMANRAYSESEDAFRMASQALTEFINTSDLLTKNYQSQTSETEAIFAAR